ncbi:MAG: methylated-DNA--[protein]-cysteine S-methyltransferase [Anaerolineae bacterium]|nr:methylated-DNA--[protein]-cysteine S-methyltransferase [Anaerolineae bacterium]
MSNTPIYLTNIHTPIGGMVAGACETGICLLEFNSTERISTARKELSRRLVADFITGSHPHLATLMEQLDAYFAGQRRTFDLPLVFPGSAFQVSVWQRLLQIPYGQTISYEKLALDLGNILSIRAVAHANGQNRLAILIPCHRVINKDGGLGGYGGGLPAKQWLLDLERGQARLM